MEKNEIITKLKEIIIKSMELKKRPEEVKGQDLILELGINSVDALEILVMIENTFGIQVPDEDLSAELLKSIDQLAEYIIKRRKSSCV